MKAKAYLIYVCAAAVLSTLLFVGRNHISSFTIICIIAAVFTLAGATTLIAIARVRTANRRLARAITTTSAVAAVVSAALLMLFHTEVAAAMPAVMGTAVAVAAVWQAVVILRPTLSAVPHSKWVLIAPAALIAIAMYLWLLPAESDPQMITAGAVAAAVIAAATAIEAFLSRKPAQSAQNTSLTPLEE